MLAKVIVILKQFIHLFLWRILLLAEDCNRKRTPIDHLIPIFLWPILLPIEDSNRNIRGPQWTNELPSSYCASCFVLEIATLRGPKLITQSPSSYGVSCFLLKIAIVKQPQSSTRPPSYYSAEWEKRHFFFKTLPSWWKM